MSNIEIITLLKEYFKEILSVLGGVGMFFIGKRSRKLAEQQTSGQIVGGELENVEAALKIYRGMLEDLHLKLMEAEKAYTLLEERFQVAMKRNKDYESEVSRLTKQNDYLTDELNNCRK